MGYFKDIDYRDKSAHPSDRVPADTPDTFTPDGPAAADDLRGAVGSDGSVNAPVFVVKYGASIAGTFDLPYDVAHYFALSPDVSHFTVNGFPAADWLRAYDQLKPWLKEAR